MICTISVLFQYNLTFTICYCLELSSVGFLFTLDILDMKHFGFEETETFWLLLDPSKFKSGRCPLYDKFIELCAR